MNGLKTRIFDLISSQGIGRSKAQDRFIEYTQKMEAERTKTNEQYKLGTPSYTDKKGKMVSMILQNEANKGKVK